MNDTLPKHIISLMKDTHHPPNLTLSTLAYSSSQTTNASPINTTLPPPKKSRNTSPPTLQTSSSLPHPPPSSYDIAIAIIRIGTSSTDTHTDDEEEIKIIDTLCNSPLSPNLLYLHTNTDNPDTIKHLNNTNTPQQQHDMNKNRINDLAYTVVDLKLKIENNLTLTQNRRAREATGLGEQPPYPKKSWAYQDFH